MPQSCGLQRLPPFSYERREFLRTTGLIHGLRQVNPYRWRTVRRFYPTGKSTCMLTFVIGSLDHTSHGHRRIPRLAQASRLA